MGKIVIHEGSKVFFKLAVAFGIICLFILTGSFIIYSENKDFGKALVDAAVIVTNANIDKVSAEGVNVFWLIILGVMGVVINFYFIYLVLDFVIEGKFGDYVRGAKKMKDIKSMKDHYIICGGGRVGLNVAKELQANNLPVVVIEREMDLVEKIESKGLILVKGDALDDETLRKAGLDKAKFLVACLNNDGDNILLSLTAKDINPNIRIAARANEEAIVKKLYNAGAEFVVLPEVVGGVQLAKAVSKQ